MSCNVKGVTLKDLKYAPAKPKCVNNYSGSVAEVLRSGYDDTKYVMYQVETHQYLEFEHSADRENLARWQPLLDHDRLDEILERMALIDMAEVVPVNMGQRGSINPAFNRKAVPLIGAIITYSYQTPTWFVILERREEENE